MPAVVGAVAAVGVSELIAGSAFGAALGSIGTLSVGKLAGGFAGAIVGSLVTSSLTDRPSSAVLDGAARGTLINTASTIEPIPVVYGRRQVGGPVPLRHTTNANNGDFYKVVVLSEGECWKRGDYFFDNRLGSAAGFVGIHGIEFNSGTDAQAASVYLTGAIPAEWTATDTGSGVCYVAAGFAWSAGAYSGEPVVTVDLFGKKVYDPRDTVTRWSNNPALVIRDYLTNERYGCAIDASRLDDASFQVAANVCDERVSVPTHTADFTASAADDTLSFSEAEIFGYGDGVTVSSSGSLPTGLAAATTYYVVIVSDCIPHQVIRLATSYANALAGTYIDLTSAGSGTLTCHHVDMPRYTIDGVLNVDRQWMDNLRDLLAACRGTLIYSGGLYGLIIDQTTTAKAWELNEDNIVGGWEWSLGGKRSRFNRVTARFINPAASWQPDVAIQDDSSLRSIDNGLLLEEQFDVPFCTNLYRAQTIAQQELKQSRYGIVVSFTATIAALRAEIGDVIPITHTTPGWVSKKFRIVELELLPNDEVRVTAREYNSAVYTLDALTAADLRPDTTLPNPLYCAPPTSPALSMTYVTGADGSQIPFVRLAWTASTSANVSQYEVQGRILGDPAWHGIGTTSALFMDRGPAAAGATVQAQVRAINVSGAVSDWASAADFLTTIIAPPTSLAASDVVTVQADGTVIVRATITWTASTSPDVVNYEMQAKLSTDVDWGVVGFLGNVTTLVSAPLTPGLIYNCRVRAISSSGVGSAWTATLNHTVSGDTTAPSAPSSVAASGSVRSTRITWANPADTDYAYTEVWEAASNDRTTATKIATVAGTAYDRVGLSAGAATKYYWTRAVDFSGNVGAWNAGATSGTSATTTEVSATDASTILATKLNKVSADTLQGTLSIDASSSAGVKVGTITWDSSGNLSSGTGVAITTNGIVGASGGVAKFVLKADGTAIFAGSLDVGGTLNIDSGATTYGSLQANATYKYFGIKGNASSSSVAKNIFIATGGAYNSISFGGENGDIKISAYPGSINLTTNLSSLMLQYSSALINTPNTDFGVGQTGSWALYVNASTLATRCYGALQVDTSATVTGAIVGNTSGGGSGGGIRVEANAAAFVLKETDASADNKYWDILADGAVLNIRAVNDANNSSTNAISITRSGAGTPSALELKATALTWHDGSASKTIARVNNQYTNCTIYVPALATTYTGCYITLN